MIDTLVRWSIRHRAVVIAGVFALAAFGGWSALQLPCDALPDTGDRQVIIYSRWDRSPDIIEDQVTYPIVTRMMGMPRVKTVRGISDYGTSWVYVIFEDGADRYWARTRTQEYLASALQGLPQGVKTELGPDANGLGWVFQYVLTDPSGKQDASKLRTVQDWYVRYHLRSVPGVAEVATVGGFEPQYQVTVDPVRLRARGVSMSQVVEAVKKSNNEAGGRLLEIAGAEYMIRGRGYLHNLADLENVPVSTSEEDRAVVRVRDVGTVAMGPEMRRGVADWNGAGEHVSGIVVMREGANALEVIRGVKAKLLEIQSGLPAGVKVETVYDRSVFIERAVASLRNTLLEIMITVALIIALFLGDFAAALIPIITAPLTILIVMAIFPRLGLSLNILSLGGLALAAGALVDASIVVVEQVHKKLEHKPDDVSGTIAAALREVCAPAFCGLLVMAVSFLPILALDGQEGRLFQPLVWAKTLTVLIAALLAVTLDPALRVWLAAWLPSSKRRDSRQGLNAMLVRFYTPIVEFALRHKQSVLASVLVAGAVTVPLWQRIGTELMPPLDEGVLLYMPSTMPGISIAEAGRLLRTTDRILKGFPEVESVLGKAGRAGTATDPAPLSMLETLVVLKPRDQWRPGLTRDQLIEEMDRAVHLPGVSNSWTMPVRGRIDMLATGMRGTLGLKITGSTSEGIQKLGEKIQAVLKEDSATRSVFAERTGDGYYLDINWDREELGRRGISMEAAQVAVQNAIGGETVTEVVDGRARYPVNVRYMRDFRSDVEALQEVLVAAPGGEQVPLRQLAAVHAQKGPSMIRDENGLLTGYVYIDPGTEDARTYQSRVNAVLRSRIDITDGYVITWSGQYEALERMQKRMMWIVPLTLGMVLLLIRINTRSWTKTGIVMLAVPFSLVGALWILYLAGYHLSTAVWVGLIALMGVDAQTGVFMLLYLDLAYESARSNGRLRHAADLKDAILEGAAVRIRPKLMTVATMAIGLLPILWSNGTGADLMKRIAAPMVGGLVSSFLMELLVYPVVYMIWRERGLSAGTAKEKTRVEDHWGFRPTLATSTFEPE